jgi:hypothetical protein
MRWKYLKFSTATHVAYKEISKETHAESWYGTLMEAKSSIEVTKCTSSNILIWFGRGAPKKSVAGLRESLISSPFENLQKN